MPGHLRHRAKCKLLSFLLFWKLCCYFIICFIFFSQMAIGSLSEIVGVAACK